MGTSRLEAFSDGVLAVIITIMVLDLKPPHGTDLNALLSLLPNFLVYILSFQTIGTYWNNHHHLIRRAKFVTAKIMWANLNLLFWLSLIPFSTAWLSENYQEPLPTALFGINILFSAFSYFLLQRTILAMHSKESIVHKKIGKDSKGLITIGGYILAIILAWQNVLYADVLYVLIALMWFIPDKRLEFPQKS